MKLSILPFIALLTLVVPQFALAEPDATTTERIRAVYHLNELDKAAGLFRNVTNHLNAEPNTEIVIVAHGEGGRAFIDGTTDSKGRQFEGSIAALANRGVRFELCNNTIEGLKLDRDQINLSVEIVPSGVAEIAKLQHQGYVYLKP